MAVFLAILTTSLVTFAAGLPCSPCEHDSDCLPYLEFCNLPNELFNFPGAAFDVLKSHHNVYKKGSIRTAPFPKEFYRDLQEKDMKNDDHSGDIGLVPKFPRIAVGKRNALMLDAANTLNHTTRAKRMTILPDPSHGPIDHRHHCPIESMIGVERRGLPFSCQTRQVPLLVFVGLLGFISSCILGCCFRKCLKALCCCCFCNYAEAIKDSRKSKNVENIPSPQPSSNRDVVMIKI